MNNYFNPGKLADDLQALVSDAERLLKATLDGATDKAAEARERAEESLEAIRGRLDSLQRDLKGRARDVDDYVHANPWRAIAIAGGVALVIGLVMGRNK